MASIIKVFTLICVVLYCNRPLCDKFYIKQDSKLVVELVSRHIVHCQPCFRDFINVYAQKHQQYYFLFQNGPHILISPAKKTQKAELCLKTDFYERFCDFTQQFHFWGGRWGLLAWWPLTTVLHFRADSDCENWLPRQVFCSWLISVSTAHADCWLYERCILKCF